MKTRNCRRVTLFIQNLLIHNKLTLNLPYLCSCLYWTYRQRHRRSQR